MYLSLRTAFISISISISQMSACHSVSLYVECISRDAFLYRVIVFTLDMSIVEWLRKCSAGHNNSKDRWPAVSGVGAVSNSLWTELNMSSSMFSDKPQKQSGTRSNCRSTDQFDNLTIFISPCQTKTQMEWPKMDADLHHGNNIHRITSCLAISLQSKSMFVLLLLCFISSWSIELLFWKSVNLGLNIVLVSSYRMNTKFLNLTQLHRLYINKLVILKVCVDSRAK